MKYIVYLIWGIDDDVYIGLKDVGVFADGGIIDVRVVFDLKVVV